jgi:hypothetical protein
LSRYPEKQPSHHQAEILALRLPEELMDTIRDFCAHNDITIETFEIEALSEKLNRWKE